MQVDQYIKSQGGYWDLPWLLAAIVEELGELSRELQSFSGLRGKKFENWNKKTIEEETGDLLFALICLTNYLNINLENAVKMSLNKYEERENVNLEEIT